LYNIYIKINFDLNLESDEIAQLLQKLRENKNTGIKLKMRK